MPPSKPETSLDALRKKLRGVTAIFRDPAATDNEKENAAGIKDRLEAQLTRAGEPNGDWSDVMFRLGRMTKEIKQSSTPAPGRGDWTDHAFRLGRVVRGLRKWRKP